jgi:hypothetical protein
VDCAAIVDEFDVVDWCGLFSGREVDQYVDLFYEPVYFFKAYKKKCVAYPQEDFLFIKLITSLE